jgi:hypothetical protein
VLVSDCPAGQGSVEGVAMTVSAIQLGVVLVVVAAAAVVLVRFEVLCLKSLAVTRTDELRYLTRTGWTAAIVFLIPLGGLLFLSTNRNR